MSCRKSGYSFKCIIKSCGEIKTEKDSISFFSFPKDSARSKIWLERCQLPADTLLQKKNVKLCGKHFEKVMFLNFLENRLKPDAIPTLFPDKKDDCDASTSGNNEILALPLPSSTGVPDSIDCTISPGTSFSSKKSKYSDSPSDLTSPSSAKGCQTLKSWSEKTPRKVLLRQQLRVEKEARLKAEKTILALSNQLSEFNSVENLLSLCEQHLSPAVLTIVKSNLMCETRNPHGYRFPKNEVKKQAWANILGVTLTTHWNYVCGNHFSSDSYAFSNARKILKPTAIPFINTIITQNPKKCTQNDSSQTTKNVFFDHCYAASSCPPIVCASTSNNPQSSEIDIENCDDLPCSPSGFTSTLKTSNIVLDFSFDSCNILNSAPEPKRKKLSLDTTPTYNGYPKKKRFFSSSRFGDLSVSDFETPQQAKRNFAFVQNLIYQLRSKNKVLNQRNKRLISKVSSLNHMMDVLKKKSKTEFTADNLEALGSDVLINLVKNCLAGKRESYTNATKEFSETLHRHSPKAYCYVRNTLGKLLPHPRTIRRLRKKDDDISSCQT